MKKKLDKSILYKIETALDEIRPFLQEDGGNIEFVEMDDDFIVKVKFLGSCGNCNISMQTLKNGVEKVIKQAFPKVKKVVSIN